MTSPSAFAFTDFPLMKLPFELRCMVYQECLTASEGIINVRPARFSAPGKRNSPGVPFPKPLPLGVTTSNILLLNRQVYEEAIEFLQPRTLVFSSYVELVNFLENARADALIYVEEISIYAATIASASSPVCQAFRLLHACQRLQRFVILPARFNSIRYFGYGEMYPFHKFASIWLRHLAARNSLAAAMEVLEISLDCFRASDDDNEEDLAEDRDEFLLRLEESCV